MSTTPRIGGMLIGYHLICPRKAWLSMRGLWMEQESDAVAIGRLIDQTSYSRQRKAVDVTATAPDGMKCLDHYQTGSLMHGNEMEQEITKRVRDHANSPIVRVLLFGSRATGTAHDRSDHDVLIVEQDPVADWWVEEQALRECLAADPGIDADVHVIGEIEYLETRGVPGSLAYPAEQTGIVLYERSDAGESRSGQAVERIGATGSPPG